MSDEAVRPAPAVAWVEDQWADDQGEPIGIVFVAVLPDGPIHILEGSAATVWDLAIRDDVTDLVSAVAEVYDREPQEIGEEIRDLLADLLERGLVEPRR